MKTEAQKRQHLLALLAISVVALFAGDKLVVQPLTASWKARQARIAKLEKDVRAGSALLDRDRAMRDRWNTMRKGTLPKDRSAAEQQLLSAFDKWSREARISVSSVKPQWKRGATDDHSLLECRVDASGSLSSLSRFLYELEQDPMALKIEAVELSTRDTSGSQLALGLLVSGLRLSPLEAK
ncbi:MAG: hypothetical protein FJ386_00650 [Verrucomicrobia bacterium]|nr:hypothetical protein [Verrucomicrobiota bacterium]